MEKSRSSSLSSEAYRHLENIGEADVMIGIPSYNNVLTASFVISQAVKGLETYFSNMRSTILVSDGNSIDGTLTSVKTVQLPCKPSLSCNMNLIPAVYLGIPGKGSALKAIFEAATFLGAKAVILVDSDLRSITPEWISLLLSPVLKGTGLVTPLYNRRKYDGTITNFLCYPLTASLFGKNIRQPIGGDFGLSIGLIKELLTSPLWNMPQVHKFGIDIFETHTALAKGFDVKQAFLGIKDHDPKDPGKDLTPMFRQVIGTMFACIEQYEAAWRNVRGVSDVDIVGEELHVNSQPAVTVDLQNMIDTYTKGYDKNHSLYQSILSHEALNEFDKLKNLETSSITFSTETWARTVYTFIAGYHKAPPARRETLIDILQILWIGRLAAFIKETSTANPEQTEEKIKEQAKAFQIQKTFLLDIY